MLAEVIGTGERLSNQALLEEGARLLALELESCEIRVDSFTAAGISAHRLRQAVGAALARCEMVIVLGGVSANGAAMRALCEGLGYRQQLHAQTWQRIQQAYQRAGRQLPAQARNLAMLPEESIVFQGCRGVSPACMLEAGGQYILLLPERIEEYQPLVSRRVAPYLMQQLAPERELLPQQAGGQQWEQPSQPPARAQLVESTRVMNLFGISREEAEQALGSLLRSRNPYLELSARRGELRLTITASAPGKGEAAPLLAAAVQKASLALGDAVYGIDETDLPTAVAALLEEQRLHISVAEHGTNGLFQELAAYASGQLQILDFAADLSEDSRRRGRLEIPEKLLKKQGAVSEAAAAAMAYAAQQAGNSTIGLAVTGEFTGRRAGNVYAAVCDRSHVWVRRLQFSDELSADGMRRLACLQGFYLLWQYLSARPKRLPDGYPLKDALSGKVVAMPSEGERAAARRPKQERSGGDLLRGIILVVAILVFAGSVTYLVNYMLSNRKNREVYDGIETSFKAEIAEEQVAQMRQTGDYPKEYQSKFAALYKQNQDIAGWIEIPDTTVKYPVVQTTDNEFYLNHDFTKNSSKFGTPWLDAYDVMNPQCDNYVIYAHNMNDGQMFGELMRYKPSGEGLEFLKAHPLIEMDDVYRNNTYQIVSVFITNAIEQYGPIFYYNSYQDMSDRAVFDEFVSEITARSYYTSDIDIQHGDKFLTLSTCSYEYGPVSQNAHVRTVIVARRLREGEKPDGSKIRYAINPNPKMPKGFTKENSNAAISQSQAAQASSAVQEPSSSVASTLGVQGEPSSSAPQSSAPSSSSVPQSSAPSSSSVPQSSAPSSSSVPQSSAPSSSSAPVNLLEEQEDTAWEWAEQAQDAQAQAARQLATAKKQANLALQAETAAAARDAADRAQDALVSGREASDNAQEALEEVAAYREAYEKSQQIAQAYQAAVEAAEAAQQDYESTRTYADAAEDYALEKEQAESSEKESSSSTGGSSSDGSGSGGSGSGGSGSQGGSTSAKQLSINSGGKKVSGDAREVVASVVMNEMGDSFAAEALKAQAVAAYTFICYENTNGRIPSLGSRTPSQKVLNAVDAVLGEAVYYGNRLAYTTFYATSAGVTVSSKDVWGGSYDYLVSVDSEIDEQARNFRVTTRMTAEKVAERVEKVLDVELYDYSDDPEDWFEIESYTEGDRYIKSIRVGERSVSGRMLRESVLGLRSAAFEIEYDGDSFSFTTYGYGHGVGLSQTGAGLYASEEGWNYVEILEHYYPGTSVHR
ncbi:MAG: SpoIID/LytB domain-containing protein [Anaerotruncus sp.]|nr:SpoIID/LytB domain-containing protein [Anaerotruncus sp.]